MNEKPLVQWSFLQYKKLAKAATSPLPCYLHTSTQIGSKLLYYGGWDSVKDEASSQLLLYDTENYQWSSPTETTQYQEDHPGGRYGHSATLVESHPPRICIYGGIMNSGTFEFDAPDGVDAEGSNKINVMERQFLKIQRKGKQSSTFEEFDDAIYFLTLNTEKWIWSKPLVAGGKMDKPKARGEHSAVKTATNELTIFGGWGEQPMNDMWVFNYVDMEWKEVHGSGITPRARYRHTAELVGNKMYILGGCDNGNDIAEDCPYLSIHQLSLDTTQWSHPILKGENPFPRSGHSSAVIGAQTIAIFGGKRNNQLFFNDLILLDLETFHGTKINAVEAHLPTPVANCTLSTVGNKCFVFGGMDAKGNCYNDIRFVDVGYYLNSNDITVGEGASSDYNFKLLIIGDAAVGKSSLLTRFSENQFLGNYTSTIGIDFNSRMIRVDRSICKLEIWDTAGQERFSTMTANYYRGAQGALLVFDVSRRDSFNHVQAWYDRAKQLGGEELETVLIGNKSDVLSTQREVTTLEAEMQANSLGIPYVETSALNGSNVEAAFVCMTLNIKKSVDRRGLNGIRMVSLKTVGGVQLTTAERKKSCSGCG